jgi:hypothetical protein
MQRTQGLARAQRKENFMKRGASILTAGALAALPALAIAEPKDPKRDRVVGHGVVVRASKNHFAFRARSGPLGENPKGHTHFHDNTTKDGTPRRRFQGQVTCLRVSGNRATFVVDFRKVKNRSGDGVVITIADNGNPPGPTSQDRIGVSDFNGQPRPCPDPDLPRETGVVTRGDINVRDATP